MNGLLKEQLEKLAGSKLNMWRDYLSTDIEQQTHWGNGNPFNEDDYA